MGKRGTVDFREGLGLYKDAFKAEAETARAAAQVAAAPLVRAAPAPVTARPQSQHKAKPKAQVVVKAKAKNANRPAPRLRPTNVPPNPGRFASGVLEPARRPAPAPPPPKTPAEFRGVEALKYVNDRVDLGKLHGEAALPASIDTQEARHLERCLQTGAAILAQHPTPDEAGYLVGFDFGTSSSKVVVHQQGAGDLAYALPVPRPLQASELGICQQHLWRSVVWFHPSRSQFTLSPQDGSIPIHGFKTGLIQSQGNRMMTAGVTHAQAATAYLALMVAYVVGFHQSETPEGFDGESHFSRFHFGIPVACLDEAKCAAEFRRVLVAAFNAAPFAADLDIQTVKAALGEAVDVTPSGDTPFWMFEELAAVIAGYNASPDHRTGLSNGVQN
jgi:hypothetical protein